MPTEPEHAKTLSLGIIIPAFNAEQSLSRLVKSIHEQVNPKGLSTKITIVNDASNDSTGKQLPTGSIPITVLNNPTNLGRAKTRNIGAVNTDADYLCFLDADCCWECTNILEQIHLNITAHKEMVFGKLNSKGTTFWPVFFQHSQQRKNTNRLQNQCTTNFIISKRLFLEAGGFNELYTHYGFEDRDFIHRAAALIPKQSIAFDSQIVVAHEQFDELHTYLNKQYESGRFSAAIYRNEFPEEYSHSTYSLFDATQAGIFKRLALNLLSCTLPLISPLTNKLIKSNRFFSLTLFLTRLCSSLSYYKGTKDTIKL